jgi:hypothetical protein
MYYPALALIIITPDLRFDTGNNLHNFRPNNASDIINGLLNYSFLPSCIVKLQSS